MVKGISEDFGLLQMTGWYDCFKSLSVLGTNIYAIADAKGLGGGGYIILVI